MPNHFGNSYYFSGKIVRDSTNFQNERFIWPEGYTAARMFHSLIGESLVLKMFSVIYFCTLCFSSYFLVTSTIFLTYASDPTAQAMYKMEVLRDVDSRTRPLFKVTGDNGEEVLKKAILSNLFCTSYLSMQILPFI